jgi:hypothetical protein
MSENNIKISFNVENCSITNKLHVKLYCSEDFYNFYKDYKCVIIDCYGGRKVKLVNRGASIHNFRILIGKGYHLSDYERFTILEPGESIQTILFGKDFQIEQYKKKILIMLKLMSENLKNKIKK